MSISIRLTVMETRESSSPDAPFAATVALEVEPAGLDPTVIASLLMSVAWDLSSDKVHEFIADIGEGP